MPMKRSLKTLTASLLAASLLCPSALAEGEGGSAGAVVAAALSQVGYVEQPNEYTVFGEWYGLPTGYWCDMFVSWCAASTGVPTSAFPHSPACSTHVQKFKEMGCFQESAARGGSYIPQQGDVIFFYNSVRKTPASHVGLVLYTENGYVYTIEGNSLANRLDRTDRPDRAENPGGSGPLDYVVVNHYPLNAAKIRGYGVPKYIDRTPLEIEGFVDLGRSADKLDTFTALMEEGILPATSSHTCSPYHGLTRGAFLVSVATLFGFSGWSGDTVEFADVPAGSDCYDAVMSARSAGILSSNEANRFFPDDYISGSEAQEILSKTLQYAELEDSVFSFSHGDRSATWDYTIRADIATALYSVLQSLPQPAPLEDVAVKLDKKSQEEKWPLLMLDNVYYAPLDAVQKLFPDLEAVSVEVELPVVSACAGRALPTSRMFCFQMCTGTVTTFDDEGRTYIAVPEAADLLNLKTELRQTSGQYTLALTTVSN